MMRRKYLKYKENILRNYLKEGEGKHINEYFHIKEESSSSSFGEKQKLIKMEKPIF